MEKEIEKAAKAFHKLVVWQRAHQLVFLTYRITERFPKSEMFGLTSQLHRAIVSVPANIAEDMRPAAICSFLVTSKLLKGLLLKWNII